MPLLTAASVAASATLSHAFYIQQQQTARAAANGAQSIWNSATATGLDIARWNNETLPLLLDILTKAQLMQASRAAEYIQKQADIQGWDIPNGVNPEVFLTDQINVASEMVNASAYRTLGYTDAGAPALAASRAGGLSLVRTIGNLVQDSGAVASTTQIALAPACSGYYRKLDLPSCSRCAILGGKHFEYFNEFKRHDNCDCTCVPAGSVDDSDTYAPEFDAVEALRNGEIHGMSKADTKAVLDDGADISQVVNAHRSGLRSEVIYGHRVQFTNSGTSSRSNYGRSAGKLEKRTGSRYRVTSAPRLTPSEIYRQADDREHAIRLLKKYGYTY